MVRHEPLLHVQTIGPRETHARPLGRCPASGKDQYESEDAALRAAFDFEKHNRFRAHSRSAYECRACKFWHITSRR